MEYLALFVTTVLAVIGWVKPSSPPSWMTYAVYILLAALFIFQFVLAYRKNKEKEMLEGKVSEIYESSLKKPIFDILLNDSQIKEEGVYEAFPINGEVPIKFTLRNNGSLSAEDLQVHLILPRVFESCNLGRHWISQGTLQSMVNGKPQKIELFENFAFIGPAPIHPGNWMHLGEGRLKLYPTANPTIAAKIKVHCKGGAYTERHFFIHTQ